DKREDTGTPQLIIESIAPLTRETIEDKLEKSLHLKLDGLQADRMGIDQLQTILKCFRGNLAVYFHLQEKNTVIKAHDTFSVKLSDDLLVRLSKMKIVQGVFLSVGTQMRPLHNVIGAAAETVKA
ncbi:MAG: hypothetical protein HY042_10480, partial [Spirochaetia bacterium]|nr:hypothetical protein [Spirochaetia bacterium]